MISIMYPIWDATTCQAMATTPKYILCHFFACVAIAAAYSGYEVDCLYRYVVTLGILNFLLIRHAEGTDGIRVNAVNKLNNYRNRYAISF